MSIDKVFQRFQEIMEEKHGVSPDKTLELWNKNSFCSRVLEAGHRSGQLCSKKCVKNELYCRDHMKYKSDL
jgi:hypothetical protein